MSPQALFSLRGAEGSDCQRIWEWRNDIECRRASINSEPISYDTHSAWFKRKLGDPNYKIYVVSDASGRSIGYMRFEILNRDAEVSIGLDASVRGKGLGSSILQHGCQRFLYQRRLDRIIAHIKPENISSQKTFVAGGFSQGPLIKVRGTQVFRLTLERGRIGAVIQARLGSTRFPGKVLRPILGKPLLEHMVDRLRVSRTLETIIVATTVNPIDDPLESTCRQWGIPCVRGSEDDVLARYHAAAEIHHLDPIVRLTGDNPLIDPAVVDRVVDTYLERVPDIDYVCNVLTLTYPNGMEVEVFSRQLLEEMNKTATKRYEREHVTVTVRERPDDFRCLNVACTPNLAHHRWTVDTPEDFAFVKAIFETLQPRNPRFSLEDIRAFVESRPDLMALNQHLTRNQGFLKGLEKENLSDEEKARLARHIASPPLS